jgi:hypothetical protein
LIILKVFCDNKPEVRFGTLASILAPFWRVAQDLKTLIFAAEDDQPALLCFHLAAVLSGNERRKTKFQIFAKLKIEKKNLKKFAACSYNSFRASFPDSAFSNSRDWLLFDKAAFLDFWGLIRTRLNSERLLILHFFY